MTILFDNHEIWFDILAAKLERRMLSKQERESIGEISGKSVRTFLQTFEAQRILLLHNQFAISDFYGLEQLGLKIISRSTQTEGTDPNRIEEDVFNSLRGGDVILFCSNYGWKQEEINHAIGNDLYRQMTESNVGIITFVFVGCSWMESPQGKWKSEKVQALVPRVHRNNVPGAQTYTRDGKFQPLPQHFFTWNWDNPAADAVGFTQSMGSAREGQTTIFQLKLVTPQKVLPFFVACADANAASFSFNCQFHRAPKTLNQNAVLYLLLRKCELDHKKKKRPN
eukprot:TRINITY_DN9856_c0_g1_i1.p1 TRINITY_DN9856_c0_g1~~TRINITY_DN9856_c0_g1_i1.p1  ORF type:complete len:308 (+),score=40.53 TRINITY_DN9856_c0_g1_i1:79-924(+)